MEFRVRVGFRVVEGLGLRVYSLEFESRALSRFRGAPGGLKSIQNVSTA